MNKTRTTLLLSVLALLLVATYAGLYWKGHDGREATNNAYVRADSVMVTTHVAGHVDSIAPASSSAFSAVASENATGNVTKITQRMPVKIMFDPNQPDFDKVRIGMSVIAHVTTQQQSWFVTRLGR